MSLWRPLLCWLVGVVVAVHVQPPLALMVGMLLCGLLLSLFCYWRGASVTLIVFTNLMLLSTCYTVVRQRYFGERVPTAYRTPVEVSAHVVWMEERLGQSALSSAHRAELHAMLLGDRSGLTEEQTLAFRRAGASHLLALSGTHLGILLTLVTFLFLRRARFTRWRWPVLLFALALLWFYVFMVGMPKSLLRAALMATLFLLGRFCHRPGRGADVLASTVFLMLIFDPLCVFDVGAQLSVAALVGLVFLLPLFLGALPSFTMIEKEMMDRGRYCAIQALCWVGTGFAVSLSAWLATMPLVLYYFHQVQPWQLLTGIILVPFTSLLLYGGVLVFLCYGVGGLKLGAWLSALLDELMSWHDALLSFCGRLPLACLETHRVSLWHIVLLYAMVWSIWIMWQNPTRRIVFASSLLLLLLLTLFALIY